MSETQEQENVRRALTQEINAVEGTREYLEKQYGQVWDTNQLQEDFNVLGFSSPCVVVKRKSDGKKGSLFFQHDPRFYFDFNEA